MFARLVGNAARVGPRNTRFLRLGLLPANFFDLRDVVGKRRMPLLAGIEKRVEEEVAQRGVAGRDGLMHNPRRDIDQAARLDRVTRRPDHYNAFTIGDAENLLLGLVAAGRPFQSFAPAIPAGFGKLCFTPVHEHRDDFESSNIEFLAVLAMTADLGGRLVLRLI